MFIKFILTSILLLLLVSISLYAQGPPIFTDSPLLLGLEGGGIRTFGKYISTESGQTYIQPLIVPYNVTTDFEGNRILIYDLNGKLIHIIFEHLNNPTEVSVSKNNVYVSNYTGSNISVFEQR